MALALPKRDPEPKSVRLEQDVQVSGHQAAAQVFDRGRETL